MVRVFTDGKRELDHRTIVATLPPTAELTRLERRTVRTRAAQVPLRTWRGQLVLLEREQALIVNERRFEAPAIRTGASTEGDPVVILADGQIARWNPETSVLRTICTVSDVRNAEAWGVGTDDVLTIRVDPPLLARLRRVPRWAFKLSRVGAKNWGRRSWLDPIVTVDDRVIALVQYRKGIVSLDAATGRPHWRSRLMTSRVIGVVGDTVWCAIENTLVALDLHTGKETTRVKVVSRHPGGTLDANGTLHLMPGVHYTYDLTNGGRAMASTSVRGFQGLVRDEWLCPLDDGRVVGASDRGDVFIFDGNGIHMLHTGTAGESVFALAVIDRRIYAVIANLDQARGADSEDTLEIYS